MTPEFIIYRIYNVRGPNYDYLVATTESELFESTNYEKPYEKITSVRQLVGDEYLIAQYNILRGH